MPQTGSHAVADLNRQRRIKAFRRRIASKSTSGALWEKLLSDFEVAADVRKANPRQDSFLRLADAGRLAWNDRRVLHSKTRVNLQGIDFASWPRELVEFDVGNMATFNSCTFPDQFSFLFCRFGSTVSFVNCSFGNKVTIRCALFAHGAKFTGSKFGENCRFDGAVFGINPVFMACEFANGIVFRGYEHSRTLAIWKKEFSSEDFESRKNDCELNSLESDTFHGIDFRGSAFLGEANFQNRKFRGDCRFEPTTSDTTIASSVGSSVVATGTITRFRLPPQFFESSFTAGTNFEGAKLSSIDREQAVTRYRYLGEAFGKMGASREEQRFFKLEMDSERVRAKGFRRLLFSIYDRTSSVGFSFVRPLLWFGFLPTLAVASAYGALSWFAQHRSFGLNIDWPATGYWIAYSLLSSLALPAQDVELRAIKTELFQYQGTVSSYVSVAVSLLGAVHKLLTLAGALLCGLALRNLFRMRS